MYIQVGIMAVATFIVAAIIRVALAERRDYKQSWTHCGIRVSPAYVRAMERLIDPNDPTPFRTFVLRPWNPRTWQLWRMAVRVERKVFWETDKNTAWQLWRAAVLYLLTTALVVGVDQRGVYAFHHDKPRHVAHAFYEGMPYPVVYGMMRNTWGSVFGLVTLKAMCDPKYWGVKNLFTVLRLSGMPWYVAFLPSTWDITMIAVLDEYTGTTDYADDIPVTWGLLAQTCQLSEDRRMRWWFTILAVRPHKYIQFYTGSPWREFSGVKLKWMPYFGSKGSKPFVCNFQEWIARLYLEDREKFDKYFRDGMSDWFRYAPRSAPVLEPAGI